MNAARGLHAGYVCSDYMFTIQSLLLQMYGYI
jgi:hypothetical protein